jgi:hypothetical protein
MQFVTKRTTARVVATGREQFLWNSEMRRLGRVSHEGRIADIVH